MEIKGNPMLRQPKPIQTPVNFRNKNEYCEHHEDFEHMSSKWGELKTDLYELVDWGQHNRFLKQTWKNDDSNRNTEIIATIISGIDGK